MIHKFLKISIVCLGLIGNVLFLPMLADGQLAVRAGKVITMEGEVELADGVILIRDGRIEAVGEGLSIPVDYKVIDAADKVVMPGFVDIHTSGGMGQPNEQNNNVPFVTVLDTIDPASTFFEEARRNGITTASIVPGNSTMIGGQAAVLKTSGMFVADMAQERLTGLKISMQPAQGSRMSHLASLRRELNKAKMAKEEKAKKKDQPEKETAKGEADGAAQAEGAPTAEQQQQGLDVLGKLIDGELISFIYCANAMDVGQALRIVDEFRLRPVMVLGRECYKAAELLAEKKVPVVLDSQLVFWETDPRTRKDEKISLPKVFNDAGLSYMFQAETNPSRTTLGSNYHWYQAATAVKYGLSRQTALEACTILPARTLGIESKVGSIAVGKDADLVILTGDPLATQTWVEKTIVLGEVVYDRSRDERLRRLLETAESN